MGFHRFFRSVFLRETIKLLTIAWSIGFSILICMIWWVAFFNNDRIVVTINGSGERNFELVLGCIIIPMMLYGFYYHLQDFARKKRMLRKSLKWCLSLEKEETL